MLLTFLHLYQNIMNSNLISLQQFLEVVILIAMIGMVGILSNRKNLLMSVISIEMMFYGLNIIFVIGSLYLDDITGEIAAIFILTLAGAESALALALITAYYKTHYTINLSESLGE
jgi:NADH-quinone oxidoreductase subunit K